MTRVFTFLKNDFVSLGMSTGVLLTIIFFLTDMINLYSFIVLVPMFLLILIVRYYKMLNKEEIRKCFFVYVEKSGIWVCCSLTEKIKENTNTFSEGLNGDWYFNMKYRFISRTGDITNFDYKIIAVGEGAFELPIIQDEIITFLNSSYKKDIFNGHYKYRRNDGALKIFLENKEV